MDFLKFFLKLILLMGISLGVIGLYFYDKHSPHALLEQPSLTVNDATGLNPITVTRVVEPLSEQDIVDAIVQSSGPISIGAARYSMGGQTAYPDSLHFDMRSFNQVVDFNPDKHQVTVQSGITWHQLQEYIDPYDLSIKVMQDFNNFSVGGSLSVNAFGRFVKDGAIINSVRSFRIVLASGKVYQASRDKNSVLFYGAIGGYGALGVITHVTLDLVDNVRIERRVARLDFHKFMDHFFSTIKNDDSVVLHNAILYPPGYESLLDISWRTSDKELTETGRLRDGSSTSVWKSMMIDLMSDSELLKRLRKNLIDPFIYSKEAVVWRNWETSYDLQESGFISNDDQTLALRVYFVPVDEFEIFVLKMRDIFIRTGASILNITIRYVPQDRESLLTWAPKDMFSFTIVYHQEKTPAAMQRTREWSSQLIQAAVDSMGSYYMPFQIHETTEQFARAYPDAGYFFQLKEKADPQNRFNNMLWLEHYAKNSIEKARYYASLNDKPKDPIQAVALEQTKPVKPVVEAEPATQQQEAVVDSQQSSSIVKPAAPADSKTE